jgi:mannose/fructose-specific phosphotransferase system component IIA
MIGLVLVTHGKLAEEFRHAVEHVVGPQKFIETVSIGPDDDMDQRRQDIIGAVSVARTTWKRLWWRPPKPGGNISMWPAAC